MPCPPQALGRESVWDAAIQAQNQHELGIKWSIWKLGTDEIE